MSRRQQLACGALLVLAVVAAYSPVLSDQARLVYEDASWAASGPVPFPAHRWLTSRTWTWLSAGPPSSETWWTRVTTVGFSPYPLYFPRHPWQAHALSVGLHLIVVALVGLLGYRLGLSALGAWVMAAVFALHPLQVESVAYLAGREEIIAAIGALAACMLVAGRWRWWLPIGLLTAAVVAWGGKASAGVVVLLLPLVVWASPHTAPRDRWIAAWFCAPIVGFALAMCGDRGMILINSQEFPSVWSWDWPITQAAAVHRLITLSIIPYGQTVDYDYDLLPMAWRAVSCGVLALLACAVPILWRRYRLLACGIAWVLLSIAPRLVVMTPRSYLNEHQWYLPMVGIALIAGWAWDRRANG